MNNNHQFTPSNQITNIQRSHSKERPQKYISAFTNFSSNKNHNNNYNNKIENNNNNNNIFNNNNNINNENKKLEDIYNKIEIKKNKKKKTFKKFEL